MRLVLVICAFALLGLSACASVRTPVPADAAEGAAIELSENARLYNADYDSTFRASLDALRSLDDGSAKLVRYGEGIIIFRKPENTGSIKVRVERIEDRQTRVEISAKNRGRFFIGSGDKSTTEAFFDKLDYLLADIPSEREPDRAVEDKLVGGGQSPESDSEKEVLLSGIKSKLELDKGQSFLDGLSQDDLILLDSKLGSIGSADEKYRGLAKRCVACYMDLARLHHDAGEYDRAAEALKIAVSIEPGNALAHCNLGEIYKHLGLYARAVEELEKARRLDPDLPDIFINLGIIYDDHLVDDQKALENYKLYLERGGTDERVLDWIAMIEASS